MSAASLRRRFSIALFFGLVAGLVGLTVPASAATTRTVSVAAKPTAVVVGGTSTFSGVLVSSPRSPKGSPVQVQRKVGTRWVVVRNGVTLDANGRYSAVAPVPKRSGKYSYRVFAPSKGMFRSAASKTVTITALRKVTATIRKSATSINAGQPVIFRGSVSPFVRGTGIVVQRRVGSAAWSNLTTAVLSSTGTWAKTLRPKTTASYRVFVPRRGMNARDYSGATTLSVIPPPRITTTSLPSAAQAFPYSVQLSKSGGSGTWSLSKGFLPFGMSLNASTGVISGTPTAIETANFTVRFVEKATRSVATKALSIQVTPAVPPTIDTAALPGATKRVQYSAQLTKTGRTGTWSITAGSLPPGLQLDDESGEIAGTPTLRGTGLYQFTVRFAENNGPSATRALSIAVAFNDPVISTTTLGSATAGKSYNVALVKSGGAGTWSIDAGTLPLGVQLTPAGVLTGTPTQTGTFAFTVRFTESDADGRSATRNLSLVVNAAAAPEIETTELPDGVAGATYPTTTLTKVGEAGTWDVVDGDLPAGITLDGATGELSGVPTQAGDFPFTVRFTETVSGLSDTQPLSIHVEPAEPVAPEILTTELEDGTQGIGYNAALGVDGLPGTWSIASGALPPGITLGAASGNLSGTPTASGEFTFTVKYTQTGNQLSDTQQLTLTIAPGVPPVINTASLQEGIRGKDYSATLVKTGDPGFWSVTGLPSGLGVNPATGQISGTPSVSGNFLLTVTYTESASTQSATVQLYLHIAASSTIVLQTDALPDGKVGQAYSATLESNASVLLDSWSLLSAPDSMPLGLSLSGGTGTISGTPTVAGTYTILVRVSSLGISDERYLRITVKP